MNQTSIPIAVLLRSAPQLAALAILDSALTTAGDVLLAHCPEPAEPDDPHLDALLLGDPDRSLVPLLLAHFDELQFLIGRYQIAIRTSVVEAYDDIPF